MDVGVAEALIALGERLKGEKKTAYEGSRRPRLSASMTVVKGFRSERRTLPRGDQRVLFAGDIRTIFPSSQQTFHVLRSSASSGKARCTFLISKEFDDMRNTWPICEAFRFCSTA
jgi:hypothetical protein